MSCIEGEALADKKLPGPQHYKLNNEKSQYNLKFLNLCRPKTPLFVLMGKS